MDTKTQPKIVQFRKKNLETKTISWIKELKDQPFNLKKNKKGKPVEQTENKYLQKGKNREL